MSRFLPPVASAHGSDVDWVLTLVHWLVFILFAGWGAYFLWVLVRFRQRRQPVADYAGARGRLATMSEAGVVVAEAVLLVVIALPLWFSRTSTPPDATNAVVIRVVAEQFLWNVHYPGGDGIFGQTAVELITDTNPLGLDRASPGGRDDLVLINDLHVPIDQPVVIQLSSKDVVHSFGVAALRIKQDVIPGLLSPVWFTPTAIGTFEIACSQLCGMAHYTMRGVVTVETEANFQQFLAAEAALQVRD